MQDFGCQFEMKGFKMCKRLYGYNSFGRPRWDVRPKDELIFSLKSPISTLMIFLRGSPFKKFDTCKSASKQLCCLALV